MNTRTGHFQAGFTLIELIVGMALIGLVLTAVASVMSSSADDSRRNVSLSELYREGQIAQQIVTGRLSEAIYIWSSGTLSINTDPTTKNTIATPNSAQWTINTDPFIAMILPPIRPEYTGTAPSGCSSTNTGACYRFFAYYAMPRSTCISAISGNAKPIADNLNSNQWVIMQYRTNLITSGGTAWYPTYSSGKIVNNIPNSTYFNSGVGNILVDYVKPKSMTFVSVNPTSNMANGTVAFNFRMQRISKSGSYQSNAASLGATVTPRNWYGN